MGGGWCSSVVSRERPSNKHASAQRERGLRWSPHRDWHCLAIGAAHTTKQLPFLGQGRQPAAEHGLAFVISPWIPCLPSWHWGALWAFQGRSNCTGYVVANRAGLGRPPWLILLHTALLSLIPSLHAGEIVLATHGEIQ